ncbi:hypothetical protein P171DRAFT_458400 [Karstenula rhodostoma CBS 690.94]|uniref:Uncharacterized protein n=1 Tax=Karstenula rhodostoma CBS 690.94 TaxID=1392251 RepID=A0A9P4P8Z1_9PLEO|nr:hypothetical protein P171DRAFT_458400 [Karstenula rhodostoma CBS 690.94]
MWTASRAPARPQRTGSVHSIASVHSAHSRPSGYESDQSSDTLNEEDFIAAMPVMWQGKRQETGSAVSRLSQKFAAALNEAPPAATPLRPSPPAHKSDMMRREFDDAARSRSSTMSTLNGDDLDFGFPEKTPTNKTFSSGDRSIPPVAAPVSRRAMGPLESQLAALMDKVSQIEAKNPVASVTPDDYAAMKARLETLEAEKRTWQKRHEAIWALRDEDVENNIKIRGVLATTRRELEAMTKLRDEDLANVQAVRIKLAEATKQVDRLRSQAPAASGRTSPMRGGRPPSMLLERRDTTDLFAAAKAAALEQRALEMEKRNTDLLQQLETLKGGANIGDLNRMTAHKAWKDEVASISAKLKAKDAEIAELRAGKAAPAPSGAPSASAGAVAWHRVEAIHEEHASYRERMGGKLAVLRSEKEALQKELHRKEDECHALEGRMQSLQRRMGA